MTDNKPVRLLRTAGVVGGDIVTSPPSYILRPRNAMMTTSGGKCIAVVMDPNDSTAPAGGNGDGTNVTKIYVYESTDRNTWTLVATVTPTNGLDKSVTYDPIYACALGQSNQVFLAYRATGGTLRLLILTLGTYAISSDTLISAAVTGGSWTALDVDSIAAFSGGVTPVLVIAQYIKTATTNDHMGYSIFHRRSSDGVWLTEKTQSTDPGNRTARDVNTGSAVTIRFLNGSTVNTATKFAYGFSVVDTAVDQGYGLNTATLNADTGGMTAVATIFDIGASKSYAARSDTTAGAPNLLTNPSFENNTPPTWTGASITPTVVRINMCTNPSFETDVNDWQSQHAPISRSTAQAAVGTACLATSGRSSQFALFPDSETLTYFDNVVAGLAYSTQFRVRAASTTRTVTSNMIWFNSSSVQIGTSSTISHGADSAAGWTTYSRAGDVAPAGAVRGRLFIHHLNANAVDLETHYIDAVMIEQSATVNAYFDGSTTAAGKIYAWLGTANNSTSTETVGGRTNLAAADGLWSLAVVGSDSVTTLGSSEAITVTPGQVVTAEFQVKAATTPAIATVGIDLVWSTGAVVNGTQTADNISTFTRYSVSGTAPAGATSVTLRIRILANGVGGNHYLDAASLIVVAAGGLPVAKLRELDIFPINDTGDFMIANAQFVAATTGQMWAATYSAAGAQVVAPQSKFISSNFGVYQSSWSNGVLAFHYVDSANLFTQLFKVTTFTPLAPFYLTDQSTKPITMTGNSYYHGSDSPGWNTRPNEDFLALVPIATTGVPQSWYAYPLQPTPAPVSVTPALGSTVSSSTPPLGATVDLNMKVPQSRVKMYWQFATSPDFATLQRNFIQTDANFFEVDNTDVDGNVVVFGDTLSTAQALRQGVWYVRALTVDEWGKQGAWSASQTFTVSHPPSATPVGPSGTNIYGTGAVTFNWNFSDSYVNDFQTAYEVIVEKNSDGSLVYDSGKVTSTVRSHTSSTIPAVNKDTQLRWKVRVWDMDDVSGAFSSTMLFEIEDPPTITVNSPTGVSAQPTPFATANFTPTVAGGRTITKYSISITQGATTIYDTGGFVNNTPPTATGVPIAFNSGSSVYKNNQSYSITIKVQDSDGLEATSVVAFSTHWTPPLPGSNVAADITNYNVEGKGYVRVIWDDTARDATFVNWIVYRKIDEIDPGTLTVLEAGSWVPLTSVYIPASTYIYDDYQASAAHKVSYYVSQVVSRFGDLIESETITPVVVYPHSDGYWIMTDTGSIRLSIVTGDTYTDEYEESAMVIFGRGRYVDRGSYLGITGQLDARLRDTNGTSARMKKRKLEQVKSESQNTYLRTPFGDIYRVSVGNLSISRVAGVGEAEFVDVGIPYSEIAADAITPGGQP